MRSLLLRLDHGTAILVARRFSLKQSNTIYALLSSGQPIVAVPAHGENAANKAANNKMIDTPNA